MDDDQNFTDILYYIPEDGERINPNMSNDMVQTHYNVFTIPGKNID